MELAGSTFGEDDLATQKSLYLHNALNGFLPLLYEINSEGVDYDRFLEACGKVWKSLETNSELPDNLVRFFTLFAWKSRFYEWHMHWSHRG